MELRSRSFQDGGMIPKRHTCDGPELSPPLEWSEVPEGTNSFALLMEDEDAPSGTWVHWIVYDLPAETRSLPEGITSTETLPRGGAQGKNDFGRIGYGGPCPSPGRPHRYLFRLYALDGRVNLPPGASKEQLLRAIAGRIKAEARLVGKYSR
jgi:Raf kinase inhibitor-like YbhB/YbcL family protein